MHIYYATLDVILLKITAINNKISRYNLIKLIRIAIQIVYNII